MKHFYAFPKIEYSDNLATNVMVRGKVRDAVLTNVALYYKYEIEDHMKAEMISHKYYGSPNYVWAIYYANNILDPRYDWPMNDREFEKYIVRKYGSIERAQTKFTTDGKINHESVHHYLLNDNYIIDKTTFNLINTVFTGYKTYQKAYSEITDKNLSQLVVGDFIIDKNTFLNLGALNPSSVTAVSFYEHELNENNKKRNIFVIDKSYLYQIVSEFEILFD